MMKHAVIEQDQLPDSEYVGTILSLHDTYEYAEIAQENQWNDLKTTIEQVADDLKIGDRVPKPTAQNYASGTDINLKLPPK